MRKLTRFLPALLVLALAHPFAASADQQDVPPYRGTANLELVAHLPSAGGTDMEFFSRDLRTYRNYLGETITIPDGQPPVTRHFAFVGNQTNGARIIDITSPEDPFVVYTFSNCKVGQGDIQIAPGGMVASIAKQSGTCTVNGTAVGSGAILVDLADVYAPKLVGYASHTTSGHNNTIHPSGKYLYISSSGKTPPTIPIFDISDPAIPKRIKNWDPGGGDSPHDIRFSDDGTRAYMAGIDQFRIVNTTDPENPVVISTFTVPGSTTGHDALVTPDKAFLFAGDELAGGGTAPCPGGAVYVYDIRGANELSPVLLGLIEAGAGPITGRNNDEAGVNPVSTNGCTSHVMALNPSKRSLTIGWYQAGARVFDFSGLYNADGTPNPQNTLAWGAYGAGPVKETAWIVPQGANTWSAKQYDRVPGYIFADDLVLGFYVVKIKP